jgi:DNA helicase-2/ATP-dependent DNA helicase PcrA
MIGGRVETLWRSGHRLAEIAILVRAGFQTRAFEERLLVLGIPYRIIGGLRFYERQEVRDAVAYLRLLVQPADDLAFERIVNLPKRGAGDGALRTLHEAARAANLPLYATMEKLLAEGGFKGKLRESLRILLEGFAAWRNVLAARGPVAALEAVLEDSGYLAMWKADKSPDAPGRLENLKELVRALADFETLAEFLEHVALVTEVEEQAGDDKLSMMTLHGAKGLEFDTVFLPGWEEGVFPNQRTLDEGGNKSLEEERRLAYVGITRARQRAIISHAANRRIYANWQSSIPSRFIDELPKEAVRHTGSALPQAARAMTSFPLTATRQAAASPVVTDKIPVGARVFHQKFGYGRVIATDDDRLDINFETSGDKRVLSRFVERHDN